MPFLQAYHREAPNPQWLAEDRNGTKRFLSDDKHQIRLQADAAPLKENPLMEIPTRPLQSELDSE